MRDSDLDLLSRPYAIAAVMSRVGITSSSQDLKDTIIDREERNIESSTAGVIDDVWDSDLDLLSRPYVMAAVMSRVGITSSSQDLKDTIVDREERNIESSTAGVIDDVQTRTWTVC